MSPAMKQLTKVRNKLNHENLKLLQATGHNRYSEGIKNTCLSQYFKQTLDKVLFLPNNIKFNTIIEI